jgi:hypothetical protein
MRLSIKFFLSLSCSACSLSAHTDEQKYHQLGRDYVTCKWQTQIPELNALPLSEQTRLYEAAKKSCDAWKAQDRVLVFMPRVEQNTDALESWRWHALEYFAQFSAHEFINETQTKYENQTPIVNPQLSFQNDISYYDTLMIGAFLLLVPKIVALVKLCLGLHNPT